MPSQSIDWFLWHGSRTKYPHMLVEVMQMMKSERIDISHSLGALFRRWWWKAAFAGSLVIAGQRRRRTYRRLQSINLHSMRIVPRLTTKSLRSPMESFPINRWQTWPANGRSRSIRMSTLIRRRGKSKSLPCWINTAMSRWASFAVNTPGPNHNLSSIPTALRRSMILDE
jgi:hypothetical protein